MYHHTTIETTLCPYPWLGRCLVRSTQTSAKFFYMHKVLNEIYLKKYKKISCDESNEAK
jgi:hypothetical protein